MELCILIVFISLIITAIIAFVIMEKVEEQSEELKMKTALLKSRDLFIKGQIARIKDLQQTSRDQRETMEEQDTLILNILNKTITYMLGHEKKTLDVIKETIRDYYKQQNKEVIPSDQTNK